MIDPIIEPAQLQELMARDAAPRIVDIRWALDGSKGEQTYRAGHLPGAVYMDLDTALAAPATASAGRHPLPDPERFAWSLGEAGIGPETTVVAYDDTDGSQASRLVWMLRALGQDAALLNGGLRAWPGALETGGAQAETVRCPVRVWGPDVIASLDEVVAGVPVLIDARAPERYRGETEPIDARPGHVPGSLNAPTSGNVDADGRFLPAEQLRERYLALGVPECGGAVVYCGSGVTATHDLLALERAGLGGNRLYPGSYSQWSAREELPVATGEQP